MDKDNKRGFSGLSDLTSDTGTLPQSQPRQTSPLPSAPQMPVFALLELTKWPTLPAPWSSIDSGETSVWGDVFLTFQKKPKTVLDLAMEMQGKKAEYRGMIYHYAMSVFLPYRQKSSWTIAPTDYDCCPRASRYGNTGQNSRLRSWRAPSSRGWQQNGTADDWSLYRRDTIEPW